MENEVHSGHIFSDSGEERPTSATSASQGPLVELNTRAIEATLRWIETEMKLALQSDGSDGITASSPTSPLSSTPPLLVRTKVDASAAVLGSGRKGKVTVIGVGRLGLCWALVMERAGYDVVGVDVFQVSLGKTFHSHFLLSHDLQVSIIIISLVI